MTDIKKELPSIIGAPRYNTTLPSGKKVEYRPFLVKEERMLIMAADDESSSPNIIQQIIESCTFGKVDITKHSATDLEWLMLHIKMKSKGETTKFNIRCKGTDDDECGKSTEISVKLSDYIVVEGDKKNRVVMLDDENGMKIKQISSSDAMKLEEMESQTEQMFEMIYMSIDSFFFGDEVYLSKDVKKSSIVEYIDNVTEEVLMKIKDVIESLPKIVVKIDFECPHCHSKEDIEIRGMESFLD